MNMITAQACALVLVDYQARLMPAISNGSVVAANACRLAQGARMLGIPVVGTEQNPSKLGPSLKAIRDECSRLVPKMHFDACADGLLNALETSQNGCGQVVIAGCEAHVCLLQTALGLLRAGKRVWVVENASGSRRASDHAAAMNRLMQAGATIVTHEMVLFEWLHHCEHPEFRTVLALIKAAG